MTDLTDGEYRNYKSTDSGNIYILHRNGDVYSCSCPSWLQKSLPIGKRTCKHLKAFRGEDVENDRVGEVKGTKSALVSESIKKEKISLSKAKDDKEILSVMLAETWDWEKDPTGWLMSEKLDGIRAIWDYKKNKFFTRNGNEIFVPDWFKEGLPLQTLDGELWVGRGQGMFQECSSIVRKQGGYDKDWKKIEYRVFDLIGYDACFSDRLVLLENIFRKEKPKYASIIIQVPCQSKAHLLECLAITVREHGEGIIIRDPNSLYLNGRSNFMLKVKPLYDAEAKIVGYTDGKGKYSGMVGAFIVEMPNGKKFNLSGMSDWLRRNPPSVGMVVTYQYRDKSKDGIPKFAAFQRIREDIEWEELVKTEKEKIEKTHHECIKAMVAKEKLHRKVLAKKSEIKESTKIPVYEIKESTKIPVYKKKPKIAKITENYISSDGNSFWNITVESKKVTCHYGKKGCNGTKIIAECRDYDDAIKKAKLLVDRRLKYKYKLVKEDK